MSKAPRIYRMLNAPTADVYKSTMASMRPHIIQHDHVRMFQAQYYAKDRTATTTEIAECAAIKGRNVVNSKYGGLGYRFAEKLGIPIEQDPNDSYPHRGWAVWSEGWNHPSGFRWRMLPQVAEALECLGWIDPTELATTDEAFAPSSLKEGKPVAAPSIVYERNPEARRRCIEHYGGTCHVCGFDSGQVYGIAGVVHVHHLRPLSEIKGEYDVDPIEDLRPVCPNCHAIIHLGGRCRSIEEVRGMLRRST
jgi:putative restriction endonuclease